ncbi:MAG: bifunctional glutamate N-acetyltransferase/amino-acid acetyltransferase ArgJ [Omnitrophica bacterium]|nr:bifunctional glutamate N-acetyltransferase/amino-acid acetyltransferase ArgJ [Candidatus Omnitrophota bacterium]
MRVISGGITAPKGFEASGIHCGIKYKNKDLALIHSSIPSLACGVFTQNKVKAAPLKVTQRHLQEAKAQAVIINSGNANCCTGRGGIGDAEKMCKAVAKSLSLKTKDVLVASTGIIGQRLPLKKIRNKIPFLVGSLSKQRGLQAAQAIMTTDTLPKQISVELNLGQTVVRIGGMAKGAGMISPHLATMLAFITTDALIEKVRFKKALKAAVENSFNLITVEGDTSTNDMVLALANGLAANKRFTTQEFGVFQEALNFVCISLAKAIIQDAEGATKFIEVRVEGAKSMVQAKLVAFKVANSPLVKTAIFGENPNWGRIAAAVGCADKAVREDRLSIDLGQVKVLQKGAGLKVDQKKLKRIFKEKEIQIKIDLGLSKFAAKVFTCDLSNEYIKINAEY